MAASHHLHHALCDSLVTMATANSGCVKSFFHSVNDTKMSLEGFIGLLTERMSN